MQTATLDTPAAASASAAATRITVATWWMVAALAVLWFILCRHLSNEWSVNEQYSYGWFVPFFAAYLFWLRWEQRPLGAELSVNRDRLSGRSQNSDRNNTKNKERITNICAAALAVAALAMLAPLRLFEIGNPDWRPLSWVHALIVVGLTLLLIWRMGGTPWLKHFAFPVCFILVAVPWITPIEAPIVQGLMSTVAAVATETLHLFGIPAQLEGSVIRISTGVVGVNEACSGVRSLQTSLMIGLLFGELKRLSFWRRIGLVGGALAIALLANFGRAFTLVWISATQNPNAANEWHDGLGYAIVGLVFVGTMGLAALLGSEKVESKKEKVEDGAVPARGAAATPTPEVRPLAPNFLLSPFYFLLPLLWLLLVEAGAEVWYRANEQDLVAAQQWSVDYPEQAPGFREIEIDEQVRSTLRYDTGRQVAWRPELPASDGSPPPNNQSRLTGNGRASAATAFLFFFRWEPGTSTILRARSHRPDVCLPNVGWKQSGDFGVRDYRVRGGATLPFRHFAFKRQLAGQPPAFAHSFFCMREDKVPPATGAFDLTADARTSDWMAADRLRVVREGLRNPGQQVMQYVLITTTELSAEAAEARFRELLPEIVKVEGPTAR